MCPGNLLAQLAETALEQIFVSLLLELHPALNSIKKKKQPETLQPVDLTNFQSASDLHKGEWHKEKMQVSLSKKTEREKWRGFYFCLPISVHEDRSTLPKTLFSPLS